MSDLFSLGIDQAYSRAEGGGDFDLVVGDDGFTRFEPRVIPQQEFQAMSRKERREQPARITPQEGFQQFSEAMGGAIVGAGPGMIAGTAGFPGDLAALFKGAYDAATAEEGQGLNAFLNTMTKISEQYGSEFALKLIRDTADVLPVSDQVKEGIKAGAEAGSFVGIGGTATAAGKAALRGAKEYAAGAPARVAERGRFGRFTSGMDLQGALDEMIVAGKKSDGEVDTSYRMAHQPKGPDDEDPIRLDNLTQSTTGESAGYPDDFYTPKGQRIYAQGPSFEGDEYGIANLESYKAISRLRGKPNSTVTIYRGVPNDPNITTINKGDFVTLSKKYAEIHAASGYGRNGDEAGKVISQKVKVKDVYWDGNDVNEFGYFPTKGKAQ